MQSTIQEKESFLTPRNKIGGAFPMRLWLSETGNKAAQDQARSEFVKDVDRAFDDVEAGLLSNGAVRTVFITAISPTNATVLQQVRAPLMAWARSNRVDFSPQIITAIVKAVVASLWEVWRDEKVER